MSSDWTPTYTSKPELANLIGLFLYDRGDVGGTDHELEEIYHWAEETRMNQYLMDCSLKGFLIPTVKNGDLAFKITAKGEAMARELLSMGNQHGIIKAKAKGGKGNGNGNGNGNGSK